MARAERLKVDIIIKGQKRFTDEGGKMFGPGKWSVDPAVSMRLIAQGKAVLANAPKGADKAAGEKELGKGKEPPKPPANPRVPPPATTEGDGEPTQTPLPEGFPSQATLAVAGFTSVESLRVDGIKEKLEAVEGLTPADVTKIGLAISKI